MPAGDGRGEAAAQPRADPGPSPRRPRRRMRPELARHRLRGRRRGQTAGGSRHRGVFVHTNGRAATLCWSEKLRNCLMQSRDAAMHATTQLLGRQFREPALHQIQPRAVCRGELEMEPRVLGQPAPNPGRLGRLTGTAAVSVHATSIAGGTQRDPEGTSREPRRRCYGHRRGVLPSQCTVPKHRGNIQGGGGDDRSVRAP